MNSKFLRLALFFSIIFALLVSSALYITPHNFKTKASLTWETDRLTIEGESEILPAFGGHSSVLRLLDLADLNGVEAIVDLKNRSKDGVEFFIAKTDSDTIAYVSFEDLLIIRFSPTSIRFSGQNDSVSADISITSPQFVHLRILFDCDEGNFKIWVNKNEIGEVGFGTETASLNTLRFQCNNSRNNHAIYIDAITFDSLGNAPFEIARYDPLLYAFLLLIGSCIVFFMLSSLVLHHVFPSQKEGKSQFREFHIFQASDCRTRITFKRGLAMDFNPMNHSKTARNKLIFAYFALPLLLLLMIFFIMGVDVWIILDIAFFFMGITFLSLFLAIIYYNARKDTEVGDIAPADPWSLVHFFMYLTVIFFLAYLGIPLWACFFIVIAGAIIWEVFENTVLPHYSKSLGHESPQNSLFDIGLAAGSCGLSLIIFLLF